MAPEPVALAAERAGGGRPVLVLHGLFGSAANWRAIAKALAGRFAVHALDLRNHGASPWAGEMNYGAMAEDLGAYVAANGLGPVALVGHSMGGKAAMAAALLYPETVSALVVIDVAPARYAHGFEAYVAALRALDLGAIARRADAEAALAPAVPDAGLRAFLLQNLVRAETGFAWRLNLAALAASMETLAGFPEELTGRRYSGPTLFLSGGASDYLRAEHEPVIRTLFPRVRFESVPDAGHWLHAEKPQAFLAALGRFLDQAR